MTQLPTPTPQQPLVTPQVKLLFQIAPVTMQYNVPTTLIATIIQVESGWNPQALGDYRQGVASSIGLFQLHLGGQADAALQDGHKQHPTWTDEQIFMSLVDPLLNAQYAMPAINAAWNVMGGWNSFEPQDITWWQEFASRSGHPGGAIGVDPANITESQWLMDTYNHTKGLRGENKGLNMTQYSKWGEVGDFNEADQMQTGKSQFECGWFSTFIFYSMAPVGETPKLTVQQIIDDSEKYYAAAYGGDNSISNMNGMSDQQLYDLLHQIGRHYQATTMDVATIRAWLRLGYPVIVGVYETSVFDQEVGGNPYPWTPGGTHVILITGPGDGDWLTVRDPANCTNLYDPNSLRPGPRRYRASSLQFVSATAVVPYWMPQPPAGYNPLKDAPFMGVPTGWTDDGKTLSVNGYQITGGERDYILNHQPQWPSWDVPLEKGVDGVMVEESNTSIGYGYRHLFAGSQIEWTKARGGFFEGWLGQELQFVRKDRDSKAQAISVANAKIASDAKTIADLQAEVAALQAQTHTGVPPALQSAIDAAGAALLPFETPKPQSPTGGTK